MYISRLRLKGFKSFGGNHEIELSPGYTAIVGPNGSGKSNILDGIRWVLGDPSPARLRIQKQSDLLFQGSVSLPPSNEAESSLQLFHPDGAITVKRAYSTVNGTLLSVDSKKIRLQDLQDIKASLGLEGEQFAFIGQGEVAETIRHRPFQRRILLESLFGIEKYRKKRDEARKKLDIASSELLRLQTLISELNERKKQLLPLVKKASQVRALEEELDEHRRNYYFASVFLLKQELQELGTKIDELKNTASSRLYWSDIWSSSRQKYSEKKIILEKEAASLDAEFERVSSTRENLFRQCFSVATTLLNSRKRIAELTNERDRISKHLLLLQKEEDSSDQKELSLRNELDRKLEILTSMKAQYEKLAREIEEKEQEKRKQKKFRDGFLQKKNDLNARMQKNIRVVRTRSDRREEIQQEIAANESELKKLATDLEDLMSEQERVNEYYSQAYAECQTLSGKLQHLKREKRELVSLLDDLRISVEEKGYPKPVRFLSSASRLGKLKIMPVPVIDTFSAPENLAQALDSFLGGRLFWLVVDSIDEAQAGIEYLKQHGAGRVTMLPLERCRPRNHKGFSVEGYPGVIGWAIEQMNITDKWMPAIEHLMGDVLFVDTFTSARTIVSAGIRFPVVTLDGEVFSPQGAISGGFRKKGPGIVEQKLELEKQRISLDSTDTKIKELSERLKISEDREIELSGKKEKLRAEAKEINSRLNRLKNSLNSLNAEMNKVCSGIKEGKKSLQRDWLERRKIQARCLELIDKISSERTSEDGISELRVRLSKEENQVDLLREKLKSCRQILERIRNEKDRDQKDLAAKISEIDVLRDLIRNSGIRLAEKGHLALSYWKDLEKTKQMIRTVHETLKELESKLSFVQRRYSEVSELLRLIENDQNRAEQQKRSVTKDLDQLDEMWGDKYRDHGPIMVSSVNIKEVNNSIRILERKVRSFGAIDQGCLSEDQSLHERISYLEDQSRDVAAGTEELSAMIEGLDHQVETVFRRALKSVDDRFDLLFKRLFGGGEAHLTIQESDSIWDCGVDIIARPPGKKMQNLNQLSGGEQSLTAISLLFASMEVAEVPLAILDEVDAALDDVNLGRFVSLILDYAASLQLIIMTHRRITMEKASIMYGVTMKEPGLSQIVSVKLDDWA